MVGEIASYDPNFSYRLIYTCSEYAGNTAKDIDQNCKQITAFSNSSTTSSSTNRVNNDAAIAGGVIGGIALILLSILFYYNYGKIKNLSNF